MIRFIKSLIGDRTFYRRMITVMIPILIQNVITNFVSLLDNLMVGRIGTEQMSGVAIINQLLFVFNLCIFGGLAGAGIFTAQYIGKGDHEGVRHTIRFKLYTAIICTGAACLIFTLAENTLIGAFIHQGDAALDLEITMKYAEEYLSVMMWQLPLFALSQVYVSTLREAGDSKVPMFAGLTAVFVNLVFNYILIYGKLGAPVLGVKGAAIATVISRVVELAIVALWAHTKHDRFPFMKGVYRSFRIPFSLAKKMFIVGLPLFINEMLWSSGQTTLNQCYSTRGLEVMSAINISSSVSQLFYCGLFAMGTTTAILVGQQLGAGRTEEAAKDAKHLISFSFAMCACVGVVMLAVSSLIPALYNTEDIVREIASNFIRVSALIMPINAVTNCCYFTIRSGGRTFITFLFDSAFVWAVNVPTAYILIHFTSFPILPIYALVLGEEAIKAVIGITLVRKRIWVNNLVSGEA